MLASAMSSSRSGALLHHSESRWDITRASSPSIKQYAARSLGSMPSGMVVSTPASGSSKSVPKAQWASLTSNPSYTESWASCLTGFASALSNGLAIRPSHVGDVVGDVVEGRMPVDLVAAGREERILLVGAAGRDGVRAHHPDAHAFVAPGVDVPGVVQCHFVVCGVQR